MSNGCWHLFDPSNGFAAIDATVAAILDLGMAQERFCFETDVLFRLSMDRALVVEVPVESHYREERMQCE